MTKLQEIYPMKGVGPPELYLGGDIGHISLNNGEKMYFTGARKYIDNIVEKIENLTKTTLRNYNSPMESDLHPELDETPLLGDDKHSIYRMLIGSAQWAVTLGRFDIAYAVSTMARFSALPREGHLKAMMRLFGYLKHHSKGKILYDINEPFYADMEFADHEWDELYPDAQEEKDPEDPVPKGKRVIITMFVDADHARDEVSRRSVTGILGFYNCTPIRWYTKRQA